MATVPGATAEDQPVVVATTSIWADIVDEIDCADRFDVRTLIPVGGDAHAYEPSMRDAELLDNATVVIANGGGLEDPLHDTLENVARSGTVIEVFDHVTTRPLSDEDHHDEDEHADEHDHAHDGDDPHVWFDPTLVAEATPVIRDALVAAGGDPDELDGCASAYLADLDALDAELAEILDAIPEERRLLVTNHDALGYFADRYDLEILGSVLPSSSTLVEASVADLEDLAELIDDAGVPAIFAEALESTDEASTLADRLGVDVVTLYTDSLGEDGSGAETYFDLMRFDATAIAEALS